MNKSDSSFIAIKNKLIAVKNRNSNKISFFNVLYIPEQSYIDKYCNNIDFNDMLNCCVKNDYSGIYLYTSLGGLPVGVSKYVKGVCTSTVFLGDPNISFGKKIGRMQQMVRDIKIVNTHSNTRLTLDPTYYDVPGGRYTVYIDENGNWHYTALIDEIEITAPPIFQFEDNNYTFLPDSFGGSPTSDNENGGGTTTKETNQENVTLSVSSSSLTIGDPYTLTVSIQPAMPVNNISFLIVDPFAHYTFYIQDGLQFSCSTFARVPYSCIVYAEVVINNADYNVIKSNEIIIDVNYPLRSELRNNPIVNNALENAWSLTLRDASVNGIREYGGVVYLDTTGSQATVEVVQKVGEIKTYEQYIEGGAPTIDLSYTDQQYSAIAGGRYAILNFHTHPPLSNFKKSSTVQSIERMVGSSPLDRSMFFPGILKDYVGKNSVISSNDPVWAASMLYDYGPERRSNQ